MIYKIPLYLFWKGICEKHKIVCLWLINLIWNWWKLINQMGENSRIKIDGVITRKYIKVGKGRLKCNDRVAILIFSQLPYIFRENNRQISLNILCRRDIRVIKNTKGKKRRKIWEETSMLDNVTWNAVLKVNLDGDHVAKWSMRKCLVGSNRPRASCLHIGHDRTLATWLFRYRIFRSTYFSNIKYLKISRYISSNIILKINTNNYLYSSIRIIIKADL